MTPRRLEQGQQGGLFGHIPVRVAGALVGQHGHAGGLGPGAEARAGQGHQMLGHRRPQRFQKEIFVGQVFAPVALRLALEFGSGADARQDSAVSLALAE